MARYETPPMHDHGMLPTDLLSKEELDFLAYHYKTWNNVGWGKDYETEMAKKFTVQDRAKAAEYYEMFRDAGFYPAGYEKDGSIKWKVMLKGKVQMMLEKNPDLYFDKGKRMMGSFGSKVFEKIPKEIGEG